MNSIEIRFKHKLGNVNFDIDIKIPNRGITSVFGKSGAGKTTLINVIAGLNTPEEGRVIVSGKTLFCSDTKVNIPVHKRKIGYVFQDSRLFPHYNVKRNLLYGVSQLDLQHFANIITLLDLSPLLKRYPSQLSGGEKQRVAIGRALLSKPSVLLMDEPLASLDIPLKKEVLPYLEHLAHEIELPIIYVSHSLFELVHLANHIAVLDNGVAIAAGPLETVWSTPALMQWQTADNQSSLFEASITDHNKEYALTQLQLTRGVLLWVPELTMIVSSKLRVQVSASDVSITLNKPTQTSIHNILPAKIVEILPLEGEFNGKNALVKLELAEECFLLSSITTWARDELALKEGVRIFAQIKKVNVTQKDIKQKA